MAASLDIILISKDCFAINKVIKYLNEFYALEIQISQIFYINNWLWEGECKLSPDETIDNHLLNGKIVVVDLNSPVFKDLGIFIEKVDEEYVYTFWINTDSYPELDTDVGNTNIYSKIFTEIEQIEEYEGYRVNTIAMGIETNFVYQKDRMEMIKSSENISFWSFDDFILTYDLSGYRHIRMNNRETFIYTEKM